MSIDIDVQFAVRSVHLPVRQNIVMWARETLAAHRRDAELTIRFVDKNEALALNKRWRQAEYPANVLSFPAGDIEVIDNYLLGDIIICVPVIEQEAGAQGKKIEAHFAHMVIHGILHLLDYDHQTPEDAEIMESMETGMLAKLGYDDPYNSVI